MMRLKADLHAHTADDPYDPIGYSSEMLIDSAADAGMQVLAVACHGTVAYSEWVAEYARRRGVLLVPAAEMAIEGKHVLILNPNADHARARTFADLRSIGRDAAAIVAPHPFYPVRVSLREKLIEHIDLFDAIEYCHFHFRGVNFNRRAVETARAHGLPLLGTTDTHKLPYSPSTYSWLDADPTVGGIIEAIREGRVAVETRPRSSAEIAETFFQLSGYVARVCLGR